MGDSDQKYRRVRSLSNDEYVIEVAESGSAEMGLNVQTETWKGRYVELFEFSPIPFVVITPSGVVDEVNLATCQLLGLGASRLVGQSLYNVVEVSEQFLARFLECLRGTAETISMEASVTSNCVYRFIGVRFDDNGVEKIRVAIIDFHPDVSDGDDARLTNVLLQTTDGFLFYDREGHVTRANRQARTMLDNRPFKTLDELLKAVNADVDFEELTEALSRTNLWRRDVESKKQNTLLRIMANLIANEDANVFEVLVTITEVDLTNGVTKPSDVAVQKLGEKIRNPLASLNSALELMESVTDPVSLQKLADIAKRNAQMIDVAIENLIAINEPDANQVVRRKPQSLSPILEHAKTIANEAFPDVKFDLNGDVESIVMCDAKKMVQAFSNFLRVVCSTTGPQDIVDVSVQRHGDDVRITFTSTGFNRGLEESSYVVIGFDFDVAREIVDAHGGVVERTQKDGSPVIAVTIR